MPSTTSSPIPLLTLDALPDDVLLRIIACTGRIGDQIGLAYNLAAVSRRFLPLPAYLVSSLSSLSPHCLSALSLSDATAARSALTSFFSCATSVRSVNLSGCSSALLTLPLMSKLAEAAGHSLRTINLAHCRITDMVLQPLLRCSALRQLVLVSCDGPTGVAFRPNVCTAPLETLDLSWVHTLNTDGVLAISTLVTLRHLVLTGCEAVSTLTLPAFTQTDIRLSLQSLSLPYCPVRDVDLFELLKRAPNLNELTLAEYTNNLWSTGDFTAAGIQQLRSMYPYVDIRFVTC